MHLHLDPVGGIAGDMFAAALLDLRPHWEAELVDALAASGLGRYVQVRLATHKDHALSGRRFEVGKGEDDPPHTHADIRALLEQAKLAPGVRARAVEIFAILAGAEARVHDVEPDRVHFHEIGDWDSIGDVVCAAWLIDRLADHQGEATWSCAALPLGTGHVDTAHGRLPVPVPAVALLLEGMPVYRDEHPGERVTPTGAAILKSLRPDFGPALGSRRVTGSGTGFGTRTFAGMSNVLRVLAFEDARADGEAVAADRVAVCRFEVDDQSAEDLAVGLERLRARPGVLDVLQSPAFGKKGRMVTQVQVLAHPDRVADVVEQCFVETATLGVRWQVTARTVLPRSTADAQVQGRTLRVKRASRPGGVVSSKVEIDDLADTAGGYAARQRVRRRAERDDDETST
ncbi:MAG: LarC family nickel insertion protein [Gammaproteobacteria bacterium]|nr:LarC family nickel insertion protein [Gammaproteobacteria bacterium]